MPVTVVIGGQFGSEGKGKVAHYLAKEMNATFAVRCGGANSGHTVIDEYGHRHIFRHLPTAAILPDIKLVISAGSYINEDVLLKEIEQYKIMPERLYIDPKAVIITDECVQREQQSGLVQHIGSTGSGTGAAVVSRIQRQEDVVFAKNSRKLQQYVQQRNVSGILRKALHQQERIILEGTQGFGLSVLHSPYYPKVTSRDTTAAAFIAEAGLSPRDVDDIVMVIRAFPIRVAGDSGPLPEEITWAQLESEGKHPHKIEEVTSVTQKLRRIARFDANIVLSAIETNVPTRIVLNHVDYYKYNICSDTNLLKTYIDNISKSIKQDIDFIGLSPSLLLKTSSI